MDNFRTEHEDSLFQKYINLIYRLHIKVQFTNYVVIFFSPRNVTFNDPPTNCGDLIDIGFILTGFYPVQLKPISVHKFGKIGMIYCNFQPDSSTKKLRLI